MNEIEFLKAIEAEPANPVPRLVYADWLDEQGDLRGELLRIQEELRQIDVPHRAAKEARMHELLNEGVEPLVITRTNSVGMNEILIFPGQFVMGSPEEEDGRLDDEAQVEAEVSQAFWLGQFPVTQWQWQQILEDTPWKEESFVREDPECPVTCIHAGRTLWYCRQLTARERREGLISRNWQYTLPTEAQWEYACRAGTTSPYFFGQDDSIAGDYAWTQENSQAHGEPYAHPVGQLRPNPWGLYDLQGNVGEWCRDAYQEKLPGGTDPEVDQSGAAYQVSRGSGWCVISLGCRSAFRRRYDPCLRRSWQGFRVARVSSQ